MIHTKPGSLLSYDLNVRFKRGLLALLVGCISLFSTSAQNHDATWILGEDNGGEDYFIEGNLIDFRVDPILIREESLYLEMHSTMASICDSDGNLQFYTNGCKIANWRHELIENGDGINPGEVHNIQCINETYPWRGHYTAGNQSALIIPLPGSDNIYYLFHKGIEYGANTIPSRPFYYTLVDMAANNGHGTIIDKNVVLTEEELCFGQLTAVKHANGADWWVFSPGANGSNSYYRFLLTSEGVEDAQIQEIGIASSQDGLWANFSPDGSMYVRYEPQSDDVFLFDFDRETGELSDFRQLVIEEEEEWWGGVAFSPSSRFLYVSSYAYLYQFDSWADDIAASRVIVGQYQFQGTLIEQTFWGMQLGPDCRIYVYCNSCDVIHVIQQPDEPGLACQFEQGAIQLPWPIFRSQPYFPNYRLGPVGEEEVPCTPVVSVSSEPVRARPVVSVFPNPARDELTISSRDYSGEWVLYDGLGRARRRGRLRAGVPFSVAIRDLPAGLYFWRLAGAPGVGGKVVVQ